MQLWENELQQFLSMRTLWHTCWFNRVTSSVRYQNRWWGPCHVHLTNFSSVANPRHMIIKKHHVVGQRLGLSSAGIFGSLLSACWRCTCRFKNRKKDGCSMSRFCSQWFNSPFIKITFWVIIQTPASAKGKTSCKRTLLGTRDWTCAFRCSCSTYFAQMMINKS